MRSAYLIHNGIQCLRMQGCFSASKDLFFLARRPVTFLYWTCASCIMWENRTSFPTLFNDKKKFSKGSFKLMHVFVLLRGKLEELFLLSSHIPYISSWMQAYFLSLTFCNKQMAMPMSLPAFCMLSKYFSSAMYFYTVSSHSGMGTKMDSHIYSLASHIWKYSFFLGYFMSIVSL